MKTAYEYLSEKGPRPPFSPRVVYHKIGDLLTYFSEDVPCHAERVDELLTAFWSDEDKRLVGCKIKGFMGLVDRIKTDFEIEIDHDDQFDLNYILSFIAPKEPSLHARFDTYRSIKQLPGDKIIPKRDLASC